MLTDLRIRNALPGRHSDGEGLYLEVRPNGGRWWRFKYRFEGKEKLISLGTYPEVGLKAARHRRAEAREAVAGGIDPSAQRKAAKAEQAAVEVDQASTMAAVVAAWLQHRAAAWTPGTLESISASFDNHVFPTLGTMPVKSIKPADIRGVVQAVEASGAGDAAVRVFQRLRSVFRYAIAHDLLTVDPTYSLKPAEIFKPRTTTHRRAIAAADMPDFYRRLGEYSGDAKHALELLVLTAVRPGELRGARWSEITGDVWRIPAERMKVKEEHIVSLSVQALAVLARLPRVSEFVFPSPYYPGKAISENTLNSALARMGYKGLATAHGFRTLFSTCANEHGWRGELIEKQLAHESRDKVRAAYNRASYLGERAKLMQWWGDAQTGSSVSFAANSAKI